MQTWYQLYLLWRHKHLFIVSEFIFYGFYINPQTNQLYFIQVEQKDKRMFYASLENLLTPLAGSGQTLCREN